jgi:hypothetical protein
MPLGTSTFYYVSYLHKNIRHVISCLKNEVHAGFD